MKYTFIICALFITVVLSSPAISKEKELNNQIVGSAYLENASYDFLRKICDFAGGRIAGSENNRRAIQILQDELLKLGINSELQKFEILCWERGDDEVEMLEPVNRKLRAFALGYTEKSPEFSADIINVKTGHSDFYDGIDTRWKIVLIDQVVPTGYQTLKRGDAIDIAHSNNAKAVIVINNKIGGLNLVSVSNYGDKPSPIPAFSITYEEGEWLKRLINDGFTPKLRIKTESFCHRCETANVIVRIPGKTKQKIVVGAHFDSWDLGQGAVDNGLGSAILFDIARLFSKYSPNNHYTLEFVWFNGEELGLLGARYYADNSREDVIAMLNMDMTGRPTGFNAMGFEDYIPFFENFAKKINGFELSKDVINRPWAGSDHIPFIYYGIPAFTLQAHLEKDMYWYYHDFADTFDKVSKKMLSDAAAVITLLTIEFANNLDIQHRKLSQNEIDELFEKFNLDSRSNLKK